MEICDNCGKTFKNLPNLRGGGDMDNGFFCSDKCFKENFKKEEEDER